MWPSLCLDSSGFISLLCHPFSPATLSEHRPVCFSSGPPPCYTSSTKSLYAFCSDTLSHYTLLCPGIKRWFFFCFCFCFCFFCILLHSESHPYLFSRIPLKVLDKSPGLFSLRDSATVPIHLDWPWPKIWQNESTHKSPCYNMGMTSFFVGQLSPLPHRLLSPR
jgi:hypothetical protein